MAPLLLNPEEGQWYLSVTCDPCHCRILVFRDLNNGKGDIRGVFHMTCPHCKREQNLPVEHYQHHEGSQTLALKSSEI
jgi:hypothetical protein